jgi:ATP-dependent RNA helicase DeaD
LTDKSPHPNTPEAFAALGVRPSILRGLAEAKFETPSEIQSLLIPRALAGVDILGQARTGTGKTAAFGIPILQRANKGIPTQAIILVPTRELAVQVEDEIKRLGQFTPIRSVPVYGGQKISAQMKFLKHHPEIIVGTPGRVIDLLDRRIINFDNIRFVVLDEVDRMLDIGFRDDIRNILGRVKGIKRAPDARDTESPADVNAEGAENESHVTNNNPQTIFVSATISDEIDKLARRYMREPVEKLIAPGADDKPTVEKVEQYYLSVQPWDKYRLLKMLLEKENPDLAIVFCKTKHGAQKLAHRLTTDGIECREIHGNLAQNKRERVMKNFRNGKFDILIATDLASRGIDVADISHIIQVDVPDDPEVYVHRVGRTARMGARGKAFTFITKDQGDELTKIESLINMVIAQGNVEGFVARPTPSDWSDEAPGGRGRSSSGSGPVEVAVPGAPAAVGAMNGPANSPTRPQVTLGARPLTIGSKIPLSRRHKRRR